MDHHEGLFGFVDAPGVYSSEMPADTRTDLEPFVELSQFEIDERSVRRLAYSFCEENDVVVLGVVEADAETPVTVGMLRPDDKALVHRVSALLRRQVEPVRLNAYELRKALDAGYGRQSDDQHEARRLELRAVAELSFESGTTAVEILDQILGRAVSLKASDVHFEIYENDVDVRLRIDGVLHQIVTPLARDNQRALINRLKVLADLDIAEQRSAQDGRIRAVYSDGGQSRWIDFRLAILPGPFGEDAVLRLLDSRKSLLPLPQLGLGERAIATLKSLIANPEGLLLVCGPTSSGKTTTLYSALSEIATSSKKILTVEDPIEYHFPKINQKQVTSRMSFEDYTRSFLRQNPDVILIGEIRDEETAEAALRAAQTGHLVLSTLHTNDAVRTISRLDTLDVHRHLTGGSLLGALSQRLLRRLCGECRRREETDPEPRRRIGLSRGDGPFFEAAGCEACHGTGYRGRIGIFELFVMDSKIADMVADGAPIHRIRAIAIERGMQTLLEDALEKARAGLTSLEEILRAVPYRIISARRERSETR